MKKFLCLLLAGLMLTGVVACAKPTETPEGETQESGTKGEVVTEGETADQNFVCDLPDDLNFGGSTVKILYSKTTGSADELIPDEAGGVVSDAVHKRNVAVEEQLKIKFEYFDKPDATQVVTAQKKDIQSGLGDYEIISNGTYLSVQPAMEGNYINLTKLDNINTSKHYWTQGYNDMVTFTDENMQFLASGPIAITMFRYAYLTIYNKKLFEDYKLNDLYEVVKAGDWTLDYQYDILAGKYVEKDGDGKPSEEDFYGFVTGDTISVDPYMVASNLHMVNKDPETGDLRFNSEALAPLVELCDKVQKIYNDQSTYVYKTATYDDVQHNFIINHFNNERALMATTLFLQMELNFNDLTALTYGIAPMPKLSKAQENYGSYVQDQVSCYGISAVVGDSARQEELAAVLEAMAYHSYRLVRPAYYVTALSERYMQDPQSNEVLDMIFNSLQFDFSSSCSNIFTGCVIRDNLRPLLSGKSNTISSATKNWERTIKRTLDTKYNPKLEDLKNQG